MACKGKCSAAGDRPLNRRVEIQRRSLIKDDFGQEVDSWATEFSAWANVRAVSGTEKIRAGAKAADLVYVITIRYRADLKPFAETAALRVLYDGRVLNITALRDENEQHRYIIIDCSEGSADGQ